MRILIVEDDFISRRMLKDILSPYGDCDIVVDGEEAVQAFRISIEEKKGYDLVLMDIMMPEMDGQEALRRIREIERANGTEQKDEVHVIMLTALNDPVNVFEAYYQGGATSYLTKPIEKKILENEIRKLGFNI